MFTRFQFITFLGAVASIFSLVKQYFDGWMFDIVLVLAIVLIICWLCSVVSRRSNGAIVDTEEEFDLFDYNHEVSEHSRDYAQEAREAEVEVKFYNKPWNEPYVFVKLLTSPPFEETYSREDLGFSRRRPNTDLRDAAIQQARDDYVDSMTLNDIED